MTVRSAVKRAWQAYWRQVPDMLRYLLLTLVIHLMPVVPALALLDEQLYPVLLLCPLLFVLLVLPMRQNAALVMQRALRGGSIADRALVSFADYGRKLLRGIRQTLLVLLWALPLLAVTGAAIWLYSLDGVNGSTDFVTLLKPVKQLGSGNVILGLLYVVLIYLSLWLPLLAGCAFHSGARHALALGSKQLLRRRHGRQVLTWLAAQCTLLPWLAVMAVPVHSFVTKAIDAIQRYDFSSLAPSGGMLLMIAAATLLLLLPMLPLRDLIIAAMPAQLYDETEAAP